MLIQLLANGIIMGSIYSLVALGFALVYNTTRIFHIAYAAIYMFSSYMILSFYKTLQLPLLLAFLLAIVFTIVLSILIEKIVYLPLAKRKSSLNVVLISSIGVMIVVVNTIAMFYGNETQILNPNISKSITLGSIILTHTQLAQLFVSLFLIGLFLMFLKYSKFGIKTRAMRDDDVLCTVFGMDINRMRLNLFGLSAFFAAVGSGLVAYDVGMDPYVGMPMLLNAVVALIIGGVGRFEAPILGGFIIGFLQSLAVWAFSSRWQDAVTFSLLIIFLLVRPQGLLGEKQRVV
ncbi:MAG: branched-chain amino acid ABC transporter permease [Candidatus Lokiarchaeota archaeon]|nr:branched-chain amino acid ABC transporter permease [Candidatus Lokiarchaeota archaeon]